MSELIDFLERVLDKFSDLGFEVEEVSKHLFKNFEGVLVQVMAGNKNGNSQNSRSTCGDVMDDLDGAGRGKSGEIPVDPYASMY